MLVSMSEIYVHCKSKFLVEVEFCLPLPALDMEKTNDIKTHSAYPSLEYQEGGHIEHDLSDLKLERRASLHNNSNNRKEIACIAKPLMTIT